MKNSQKNSEVKSCSKNPVILNSFQDFHRLFSARGFTLIELLVVVLIIGILAAVAVPQYQKVVRKSHGAEALAAAAALNQAISSYYLEKGTYEGITADALNVALPELKYFRYLDMGCDYSAGTSDFRKGTLLTSVTPNMFSVDIVEKDAVVLRSKWQGGSYSKECSKGTLGASERTCKDYFNCTQDPSLNVCLF